MSAVQYSRLYSQNNSRHSLRVSRKIGFSFGVAGIIRSVAVLVVITLLVIEAALLFRVGAQFTALTNLSGWPGRFYDLGGFLGGHFAEFETVQSLQGDHVIEFSTLVAIEVYLLAGIVLVLALLALSKIVRRIVRKTWSPSITLSLDFQPKVDTMKAFDPAVSALAADIDVVGEQCRSSTMTHLHRLNEALQPRTQRSRIAYRRVMASVREKISALRQPA